MADSAPNNKLVVANTLLVTNQVQVANSVEVSNLLLVSIPPQTVVVNPGAM
jgi:hypothetical protein